MRLSDGLVKMLARDKMPSSTPLSHFSSYSDRVAVKINAGPISGSGDNAALSGVYRLHV